MLSDEQIKEIIEGYQTDFADGFEQTRKAIYVEDVPMMIKEALALAEKGNQTSTKEIFGMDSAYKEAAPNPFGNMYISKSLVVDMVDYIKNLESMAEKSRWKYPDKGELPEILSKHIIFYLNGSIARPRIGMAYKDKDGIFMFFCNDTKQGYPKTQVKAWTYAPVMEEG